jgi:hypothetical protein
MLAWAFDFDGTSFPYIKKELQEFSQRPDAFHWQHRDNLITWIIITTRSDEPKLGPKLETASIIWVPVNRQIDVALTAITIITIVQTSKLNLKLHIRGGHYLYGAGTPVVSGP